MFISHSIKNNILYLEIDVNYEFGGNNAHYKGIIENINEYIKSKKISNIFNKIIITCGGIIIGSIIISNNEKAITNENIKYVPSFKEKIKFVYKENKMTDKDNKLNNEDGIKENNIIDNAKNVENTHNNIEKTENYKENNSSTNIDNTSSINKTQPSVQDNIIITVKRSSGEIINIPINEYIIGVVAAEMPASFNIEALKAQAVVARTYALKSKKEGRILTDTVSTQSFIDENEMKNKWNGDFNFYYNKIKEAVDSTDKEYISYNGNYIEALYHSTNNGKTESSMDVFGNYYPYLISVSSEFDKSASSYLRTTSIDLNTMSSKLGLPITNNSNIQIISYTDGGNIKEINIDGKTFTGRNFRELLGLRSADFDIILNDNDASITTRGFGHGVGMSQYGANGMANAGYSYKDIISHYYPGTTLNK